MMQMREGGIAGVSPWPSERGGDPEQVCGWLWLEQENIFQYNERGNWDKQVQMQTGGSGTICDGVIGWKDSRGEEKRC